MNPYSAPKSSLHDAPTEPGNPVKAVLLGLLADFGGTLLLGVLFSVGYGAMLAPQGLSVEAITAEIEAASTSGWGRVFFMVLGTGFSVLGGYVCSRVARRSDYRLGFVMVGLSLVVVYAMGGGAQASLFEDIALSVVSALATLAGIRLGMPRERA